MGNFKHQSLRSSEREREHTDKDRDRDIREKEGQERLRNVRVTFVDVQVQQVSFCQLSDKYDRDRLALPPNVANVRNKQRDSAPHLGSNSSNRLPGPENPSPRRADLRDPKKKAGEAGEEWRRGGFLLGMPRHELT